MTPTAPIPCPHVRLSRATVAAVSVLAVAVAVAASGCGGSTPTFDPTGPCTLDGRAAGVYADLEARLPSALDGRSPQSVDSGRNCTEGALGSLAARGLDDVRYAGATWDLGGGTGVSSVVFAVPGTDLPAAWIAEFYEIGARTAKRTGNIETSRPTYEGAGETWRLDTLNDLSLQTVITWQDGADVRVVLVATPVSPDASRAAHDALVEAAIRASLGTSPNGG